MTTPEPAAPIKLFISHASEDKADFVDPLVATLRDERFEVWYDKSDLEMGDSLLCKISEGLNECDYGIVVLSPSFFAKKWTRAELGGLFALETRERKVILPIWKDVTEQDVKKFSPFLADRVGVPASNDLKSIAAEIRRAIQVSERTSSFSSIENEIARFIALDKRVAGTHEARQLSESMEGVAVVRDAAKGVIEDLRTMVEKLSASVETLKLVIKSSKALELFITGAFRVDVIVQFQNSIQNSISKDEFGFRVYQRGIDPRTGMDGTSLITRGEFKPEFHHTGALLWHAKNDSKLFSSDQLGIHFLAKIVDAFDEVHDRREKRGSR